MENRPQEEQRSLSPGPCAEVRRQGAVGTEHGTLKGGGQIPGSCSGAGLRGDTPNLHPFTSEPLIWCWSAWWLLRARAPPPPPPLRRPPTPGLFCPRLSQKLISGAFSLALRILQAEGDRSVIEGDRRVTPGMGCGVRTWDGKGLPKAGGRPSRGTNPCLTSLQTHGEKFT